MKYFVGRLGPFTDARQSSDSSIIYIACVQEGGGGGLYTGYSHIGLCREAPPEKGRDFSLVEVDVKVREICLLVCKKAQKC